jgi:hypothetical protein
MFSAGLLIYVLSPLSIWAVLLLFVLLAVWLGLGRKLRRGWTADILFITAVLIVTGINQHLVITANEDTYLVPVKGPLDAIRYREWDMFGHRTRVVPVIKFGKWWLIRHIYGGYPNVHILQPDLIDGRETVQARAEMILARAALPEGRAALRRISMPRRAHEFTIHYDGGSKQSITQSFWMRSLDLVTPVSRGRAGLFAVPLTEDSGLEDWRRAVFSAELIRAIKLQPAEDIIKNLSQEASRTGSKSDVERLFTLKLLLLAPFYQGNILSAQLRYELDTSINALEGQSWVEQSVWKAAFLDAATRVLQQLDAQEKVAPLRGAAPVPPAERTRQEWQWLERNARGDAIEAPAAAPPEAFRRLFDTRAHLRPSDVKNFVSTLFDGKEALGEERRAEAIGRLDLPSYRREARRWVLESNDTRDYRLNLLYDDLHDQQMLLIPKAMLSQHETADQVRHHARAILQRVAQEEPILYDLMDPEARELVSRDWVSQDNPLVISIVTVNKPCGSDDTVCRRTRDVAWGYLVDSTFSHRSSPLMNVFRGQVSSEEAISASIRVLGKPAPAYSLTEVDQIYVLTGLAAARVSDSARAEYFGRVCAAVEALSAQVLVQPQTSTRPGYHQAFVAAAAACPGPWVRGHERALEEAGYPHDKWLDALLAEVRNHQ